jgi:3-oxoacyl-[acyl-carrier-protein] synthase-3
MRAASSSACDVAGVESAFKSAAAAAARGAFRYPVHLKVDTGMHRAGCAPDDVALFVPHQANARIVDAVLARTGLSAERTSSTIDRLGNTSAASIPLALAEAADAGTVTDGDLVLMCGFGAGLTVGTALWRWGTPTAITMETA